METPKGVWGDRSAKTKTQNHLKRWIQSLGGVQRSGNGTNASILRRRTELRQRETCKPPPTYPSLGQVAFTHIFRPSHLLNFQNKTIKIQFPVSQSHPPNHAKLAIRPQFVARISNMLAKSSLAKKKKKKSRKFF